MIESPNLLKHRMDILVERFEKLNKQHKELIRKYNSLTIWKLLRGRHT